MQHVPGYTSRGAQLLQEILRRAQQRGCPIIESIEESTDLEDLSKPAALEALDSAISELLGE